MRARAVFVLTAGLAALLYWIARRPGSAAAGAAAGEAAEAAAAAVSRWAEWIPEV